MTQFVSPQFLTRHAVWPGIRAGSTNKNISECLGVNTRTVQIIREEFGEFKGTGTRSDEKRTLEFKTVIEFEIKTVIDNSKSIKAIAMDTGVFEFLIRQTVHEDIRYSSFKMRKDQQDSEPCRTSKRTLACLSDNFSDNITPDMRPPNSQTAILLIITYGTK